MSKASEFYTTASAIARVAGVTPKTAIDWSKRDSFPAMQRGKGWPCESVDAWIKSALEESAKHQTGSDSDLKRTLIQRRIDKLNEDIEARKIENQKARGDLEPRTNRTQALAMYAGIVRNTMNGLPRDLAELCEKPSVRQIVQDKVDAILSQIDQGCKG